MFASSSKVTVRTKRPQASNNSADRNWFSDPVVLVNERMSFAGFGRMVHSLPVSEARAMDVLMSDSQFTPVTVVGLPNVFTVLLNNSTTGKWVPA